MAYDCVGSPACSDGPLTSMRRKSPIGLACASFCQVSAGAGTNTDSRSCRSRPYWYCARMRSQTSLSACSTDLASVTMSICKQWASYPVAVLLTRTCRISSWGLFTTGLTVLQIAERRHCPLMIRPRAEMALGRVAQQIVCRPRSRGVPKAWARVLRRQLLDGLAKRLRCRHERKRFFRPAGAADDDGPIAKQPAHERLIHRDRFEFRQGQFERALAQNPGGHHEPPRRDLVLSVRAEQSTADRVADPDDEEQCAEPDTADFQQHADQQPHAGSREDGPVHGRHELRLFFGRRRWPRRRRGCRGHRTTRRGGSRGIQRATAMLADNGGVENLFRTKRARLHEHSFSFRANRDDTNQVTLQLSTPGGEGCRAECSDARRSEFPVLN